MTNFEQIICVSKRENNSKRSYLFLNKYQAKYIATKPDDAINLFTRLCDKLPQDDMQTVVIGFAETATALGAIIAENLPSKPFYIHSTREDLADLPKLNFSEEHSHATEHKLCLLHSDVLATAERFIFIDDEFTTGKTVCNFIDQMRNHNIINDNAEVIVATIINCMKNTDVFKKRGITYQYLFEEFRDWSNTVFDGDIVADSEILIDENIDYKLINFNSGYLDTRKGVFTQTYAQAVENLSKFILNSFEFNEKDKNILILGTEECMYPAIKTAKYLQDTLGVNAVSFATSRSPIVPIKQKNYVLNSRVKLPSFYNEDRIVHLYNMSKYDKIIVITDAKSINKQTALKLTSFLRMYGNQDINIVKWSNDDENNI